MRENTIVRERLYKHNWQYQVGVSGFVHRTNTTGYARPVQRFVERVRASENRRHSSYTFENRISIYVNIHLKYFFKKHFLHLKFLNINLYF